MEEGRGRGEFVRHILLNMSNKNCRTKRERRRGVGREILFGNLKNIKHGDTRSTVGGRDLPWGPRFAKKFPKISQQNE